MGTLMHSLLALALVSLAACSSSANRHEDPVRNGHRRKTGMVKIS